MVNQLTNNAEALRLFFTEDVYLVKGSSQPASAEPLKVAAENEVPVASPALPKAEPAPVAEVPIVVAPITLPQPEAKPVLDFKYLGKNQRQILILVNDQSNDVSTEQGRELLRKLVKAIELTANDFALLNYANHSEAKFADLKKFFNCQLVLSFGVTAQQLELAEQPLHQLSVVENIQFVFANNLHDLDSDQTSKKVLWGSLQQLKK